MVGHIDVIELSLQGQLSKYSVYFVQPAGI